MHFIFKQDNWSEWAINAFEKINETIDSCITMRQIDVARRMIGNFIFVTALEEEVTEKDLELLIRLFELKINLQIQIIFETNFENII